MSSIPQADLPTTIIDTGELRGRRPRDPLRWNAGADLGLLIARLALGVVSLGHGVQLVFGVLGGPGLGGFAAYLAGQGFRQTTFLAVLTGVTELGGGGLVLFGLATPLAAAGLLGVLVNVVWLKLGSGFFLTADGGGFEYAFALAGLAAGVVLTGAGRLALDRTFPLFRRPVASGVPCLLLGVAAAVAVRVLLHG